MYTICQNVALHTDTRIHVLLTWFTLSALENRVSLHQMIMNETNYLAVWQMAIENALRSPLVASSISSSTTRPYFSSYSALTLKRCWRSQCNLTRREMSNSTLCWRSCLLEVASRDDSRLLEDRESFKGSMRSMRAWCRSIASLAGRLTWVGN